MTFAEFVALLQEEHIHYVELRAVDLWGRLRGLTVPAESISEELVGEGVGVDGVHYGLSEAEESDWVLLPDLDAVYLDPMRDPPAALVLCDLGRPGEGPNPAAPRSVARAALRFLRDAGIAQDARFAVELEFYLFEEIQISDGLLAQGVEVFPVEGQPDLTGGFLPPSYSAYHLSGAADRGREIRDRVVEILTRCGIPVRYHHHEGGGFGQMEIELGFASIVQAGDWTVLAKDLIARVAAEEGLVACFLPKPLYNQPGNGLHFHQYLIGPNGNVFAGEEGLSAAGLEYIGGLLLHGRALSALVSPSTNSYRRLQPGFEAPVELFFGPADRTAAVRIPGYATDAKRLRVEYRPPDATCNPYLALAGCLMAGIDGIRQGVNPVARGWGPGRKRRVQSLPRSLEEALDNLQRDHAFLTVAGVFPPELLELWVDAKSREAAEVAARPHPHEFRLYG
ncbi:MAG: glutamine synthetase family protein [Candidatus Bipolaricaulota bacterium]|nr:glutamine synthetase family protein [Candidatus Bipolaricaulota bacterium]MDW8126390.1 glutamine synthetase family protein [Candidatus Bipolaricaulota bacterium]